VLTMLAAGRIEANCAQTTFNESTPWEASAATTETGRTREGHQSYAKDCAR
jgi:hypothetical protein